MTRILCFASLALSLTACTDPLPAFDDAGEGTADAGGRDAGPDETDAGPDGMDAGPDEMDAGPDEMDAGPGDAGPGDAGIPDAGPPPAVTQVSLGTSHTCALIETGEVLCWGGDDFGELGDGTASAVPEGDDRPDPQPVVMLSNVASIHAGWNGTCAIDATDGSAMCWGHNNAERFGDGVGSSTIPEPEALIFEGAADALLDVEQSGSHLCARSTDTIYCSGRNNLDQLGRETESTPFLGAVEGLPFGYTPVDIAVGFSSTNGFTVAVLDDGTVWCWGANDDGECAQTPSLSVATPTQITELSRIEQVAAGSDFACALDDMGRVFCWGSANSGRLGLGTVGGPDVTTPTQVTLPAPIGRIAIGSNGVLAVSADETAIYGWGNHRYGQLGLGPGAGEEIGSPMVARADPAATFFSADFGGQHSCIMNRVAGEVSLECAGNNARFQLGLTSDLTASTFTPVPAFE